MRRKPFLYGECKRSQMTVGELKEVLKEYPDDAFVYVEPENANNIGNTVWAQKVLDSYCCVDTVARGREDVLMLVGDTR